MLLILTWYCSTVNAQITYELSDKGAIKNFAVDGDQNLAYRYYPATTQHKQNIIYLHGIESHSGWFDAAAVALNAKGYNVYALDRRGSGLNREYRGYVRGHVENYETLFDDIDQFIASQSFTQKPIIIGLSWGGKLALSYNMARPNNIDGLVLITPGLVSLVDVNIIEKVQIFWMSLFSNTAQFELPIAPEMFTTNPFYLDYIKRDPLRNTTASAAFLMQSRALDSFVDNNIGKSTIPTLLFLAGKDRIIDNGRVKELLKLNANDAPNSLSIIEYPEQTHSIQFDATQRMVNDIDEWLSSQ